jgi:NAD(P)-dependent dehydrogenase (short-subunit alcohol dehydrogenase family)
MPVAAVSGSAGGIGQSLRAELEARGYRVIGIDLHRAEVIADLGTPDGRAQAISGVLGLCNGRLDALVCAAGLGGTARPPANVVSLNFFGAAALLAGLRDVLARGHQPAAVALASVSATSGPWRRHTLELACLDGDEAQAREHANASEQPYAAYGCSKRALAVHVRRLAPAWGRLGVRLNAVAPGPVDTPLHQAALDDAQLGPATRAFVPPLKPIAAPAEIAQTIAFLLSPHASAIHGAVLFADGGLDATLRPDMF